MCGRAKGQQFCERSGLSEVSGRALHHAADCSTIIQLAYNLLTNLSNSVAENGQLHEATFLLSWYDT